MGEVLAGILLLSLVTVETGGLYLVKLWRDRGDAWGIAWALMLLGFGAVGVSMRRSRRSAASPPAP